MTYQSLDEGEHRPTTEPTARLIKAQRPICVGVGDGRLKEDLQLNSPISSLDGPWAADRSPAQAKWWKQPIDRAEADVFAAKIYRKGRNTLGVFIAVNGFIQGFLTATHPGGTPFLTADGDDRYLVLDGPVELPELLRRKRRHLNDTGSCWFPARNLVGKI